MESVSNQEALYRTMHNTAKSYRENNWAIILLKHWIRFLPAFPASVLDVGCGNGKASRLLSDMWYDVTGVDIVNGRYNRDGYKFITHDLLSGSMPFKEKEFDVAIAFDFLEHIETDKVIDVVRDIFRVSKKVIVSIPLIHETEGQPLLSVLHRTVKPAEWWIEILDNASYKLKNKYMTIFPDSRNGTNKLIFCGETI